MKKFLGKCEKCKRSICEEHEYLYLDGNNRAITNNSPYLCKECYESEYNEKIKSDVEKFKDNIINNLETIKVDSNIETIRVDDLIKYIKES